MARAEIFGKSSARMKFTYAVGATPIDPDEAAGLIPSHIATQSELNIRSATQ